MHLGELQLFRLVISVCRVRIGATARVFSLCQKSTVLESRQTPARMALGDGEPKESLRGMVTGENGDDAAGGSLQTSPPQLTRRLWIEVATGIDKKQTGKYLRHRGTCLDRCFRCL